MTNASSSVSCSSFLPISGARLRRLLLCSFLGLFILLLTQIGSAAIYTGDEYPGLRHGLIARCADHCQCGRGGRHDYLLRCDRHITLSSPLTSARASPSTDLERIS